LNVGFSGMMRDMRTALNRLVGIAIAAVCLLGLSGCRPQRPSPTALGLPSGLVEAAWKMQTAFVRDKNAPAGQPEAQIPSSYWRDPIKALNPIKVYIHRANIVVVQTIIDGVESGKYISIPISSYLPQNGDDGFTFTPAAESVYDYRRSQQDGRANGSQPIRAEAVSTASMAGSRR